MLIAHNMAAMNAQRMFGINSKAKTKSTEKLSSGYKVNRAADDAAGLAISEKMRRQIRGLSQGVENTQDGVSLCQVADGALAEVDEMLHRITELSVKAANDTNTEEDRAYIQEEIAEILEEIDRISDATTFNERPLFKGTDTAILNTDGTSVKYSDINFADLELVDVDLGKTPLRAGESADMLHLQAIVANEDSALNGQTFNLIFGSGSTSNSSVRLTDSAGNKSIVNLSSFAVTDFSGNGGNEWSKEYSYSTNDGKTVSIIQTVKIENTSSTEKNYAISYEFAKSADIANLEFMFHADTAYNNDDLCEGYFINGTRVENQCVYSNPDSTLTDGVTSSYIHEGNIPDSFSVIDVDSALAFTEKISFGSGSKPDSLAIGNYSVIDDWSSYNTNLNQWAGQNARNADLGFSLYYDLEDLSQGSTISFGYGIAATESDSNLNSVAVTENSNVATAHEGDWSIWIQSGAEAGDGMYVTIGEMNTEVLGLKQLNVSTVSGAHSAMQAVKGALRYVSDMRSTIGAQQNRLEHTIANEENIVENTTAAESQIRDADMAKEMVAYSNLNILEQVGHAMMAQANQSNQGVLSLIQ